MIKKTFFPIAFFFIAISWIAAEKNMDIWWIPVTAGIGFLNHGRKVKIDKY